MRDLEKEIRTVDYNSNFEYRAKKDDLQIYILSFIVFECLLCERYIYNSSYDFVLFWSYFVTLYKVQKDGRNDSYYYQI